MHPLQKDCDPGDPTQFAAWCWAAGIPDPSPSRPVPIPLIGPMLVEGVSQMLWDFGFRHHPDLQTKWIDGTAGLGMVAQMSDKEPEVAEFTEMAQEFLAETNPELFKALKEADPAARAKLLKQLESSIDELRGLIDSFEDGN